MRLRLPGFLRSHLLLATLLLQGLLLLAVYASIASLWQAAVRDNLENRVKNTSRLLSGVIASDWADGHREHLASLLDTFRSPESIDYLLVRDEAGTVVAARGWDASKPLPEATRLEDGGALPQLVHVRVPLRHGYTRLGELYFGLSTQGVNGMLQQTLSMNVILLLAVLLLAALLQLGLGYWMMRQLGRLTALVEDTSSGRPVSELPAASGLEARLQGRFLRLASSIRERFAALQENEARFHAIADFTFSAELWLDPQGRLVWINASIERLCGYTVAECGLLEHFPVGLAHPDERNRLADTLRDALAERSRVSDFEFRAVRRDGSAFWAAASWQPLFDSAGNWQGLRASIRDISEQKDDRLALRRAVIELQQIQSLGQSYLQRADAERARLMALLSAMRFGVLFVDDENRILFHNPAFAELWGLPGDAQLNGRPLGQVLQLAQNQPALNDMAVYYLEALALGDERVDFGMLTMNDGRIITQYCYRVLDAQGQANGRMWVYEDVTQQRVMAERMTSLAERDALTGLYNRHRFQIELARLFADAERSADTLALLYFDLDEFKYVNDTFGHGAGDELLVAIAREISRLIRHDEVFARLGGDEFAILVPGCDAAAASQMAQRIVSAVGQLQFSTGGHNLRPSSSLGVALYPQHALSTAELVAHADAAMYQAKGAGKSTWRFYSADADMSQHALARLSWKERISQALENDGFELHFQGIYYAQTGELAHLEALLRMHDAERPGEIFMPASFIGHAEKTGKIIDIDRWVIRKAISLLAEKPAAPSIAVNVSGRSFDEPGLPEFIALELRRQGVAPERLLVELTETAAVSDLRDAQRFIDALRATGCKVCLDDFGVGFASFAYLKQLKADVLKIDGMFVRDLPNDRDSQIFVRGMVAMAHDMGKITVAEFVENQQILDMLIEFGIDQVQGYHLDRPQKFHPGLR
ncbi:bifunctional diguanylate cyclase/phosphodiesterase [Chitinilyticum piscinae]|uniref:EAL domain-containing protein n=1 Tax=Chitinilyticum piscinae TaxID=2866724 RepID=A0A8J7K1F1_9NEIS|nr:bifunctional diguanylate cyclase/phosphodiesterase [Chitinilyticum piscinae]MBE9609101.1 EAL domain-containing protein [Chitinilyticum piscinae]